MNGFHEQLAVLQFRDFGYRFAGKNGLAVRRRKSPRSLLPFAVLKLTGRRGLLGSALGSVGLGGSLDGRDTGRVLLPLLAADAARHWRERAHLSP